MFPNGIWQTHLQKVIHQYYIHKWFYSQMISKKFRLEIPLSCMSSLFRGVCRYHSFSHHSRFENYQYSRQGHFLAHSFWKGVEQIYTFPKDNMPGYLKNVKFLYLISQSLARLVSCWRQPGVNTNISQQWEVVYCQGSGIFWFCDKYQHWLRDDWVNTIWYDNIVSN